MRNPTKKFLTLLLALAVACLPLQAFACEMNPGQAIDHSAMQMSDMDHMDHPDEAGSNCCDPQHAAAPGDCAWFMHCGSCVATTLFISYLPQAATVNLHLIAASISSGEIAPSHSSPPYHPPTIS